MYESQVNQLKLVTEQDIIKIMLSAPVKSCQLDPVPAVVFKQSLRTLAPTITSIINKSLQLGTMPGMLKGAMVHPLLKKPQLDTEDLNNYQPVSNLTYISKVIERVVAMQLNEHLVSNSSNEAYQSAYRQFHSTKTALTCVMNGILLALDQRKSVFLVLLDLSAAFDTVSHQFLLGHLAGRIGLGGVPLRWVSSYLTDGMQFLSMSKERSECHQLKNGVPQGSV